MITEADTSAPTAAAITLTHLDPDGDVEVTVRCQRPDDIELHSPFDRASLELLLGRRVMRKSEDKTA